MKKYIPVLFVLLSVSFPLNSLAAKTEAQSVDIAVCNIKGGKEPFVKMFSSQDYKVTLNKSKNSLDIEFNSEPSSTLGELTIKTNVQVPDYNPDDIPLSELVDRQTVDATLLFEKFSKDKTISIVSLNEDKEFNSLSSKVLLKVSSFKGNKASGTLNIGFPRTVVVPTEDVVSVSTIKGNGEIGESLSVNLDNAKENGQIHLLCKFKSLAVTLVGASD